MKKFRSAVLRSRASKVGRVVAILAMLVVIMAAQEPAMAGWCWGC